MLSGDTEILTSNGWKEISTIRDSDRVCTQSGGSEAAQLIQACYDDIVTRLFACEHFVTALPWQPFLTARDWKLARELQKGDRLIGWNGQEIALEDTWESPCKGMFYALEVPTFTTRLGFVKPSRSRQSPLKTV